MLGWSLTEKDLTVAHSAMAAGLPESSDLNFEGFVSVCQIAKATIEECSLVICVPNCRLVAFSSITDCFRGGPELGGTSNRLAAPGKVLAAGRGLLRKLLTSYYFSGKR